MTALATRESAEIVQADGASLMAVISRAASDPSVDVDKLERLMSLYERITSRQAEADFNAALSDAQSELRPVAADASNPQTKSKYASYPALDRAVRPIYVKHGFSLSFNTADGGPPEHVRVLCKVGHKAGHSELYHVDMPADGKGAKGGDVMTKTHAAGSAMSYGQRYLLKLIFNIAVGDDDDGNAAGAGDRIDQDQVDELNALMDEVEADRRKFLNFFRVDGLSSIRAKDFRRAVAMLEAKRKQAPASDFPGDR